jgi:cytosine/adenosine deaminase-related metal-dependent hydrolase
MRKISARYIYTIASQPIKDGIVIVNDDGTIADVLAGGEASGDIEYHEGIICPGFVNTHCHLELSHMKGKISERTGMTGFISELLSLRPKLDISLAVPAMEEAEEEMMRNGIVAVGDISNDASTFALKERNHLKYHTFIELFDIFPQRAQEVLDRGTELQKKCPQRASLAPHAPYTVSSELFSRIRKKLEITRSITSLHNQESLGESELFISKSGKIFEMFKRIGNEMEYFTPTGKNSLRSVLPQLPSKNKTLLVHNTYTSIEDIDWAKQCNENIYWCFCPNVNLYIEDALPNFNAFVNANVKCTIGTDSYASNWSLSVLDELKVISKASPEIPLQALLTWATKNGAEFLEYDELGTIEKGKRPGLNLIEGTEGMMLTANSKVKKLA